MTLSKICPLYQLSAQHAEVFGEEEPAEPGLVQVQGRGHGLHRVRVVAEVGLVGEVCPGVDRVVAEGEHYDEEEKQCAGCREGETFNTFVA